MVVQKIIEAFETGKVPANPKYLSEWLKRFYLPLARTELRKTFKAGQDYFGFNEGSSSEYAPDFKEYLDNLEKT